MNVMDFHSETLTLKEVMDGGKLSTVLRFVWIESDEGIEYPFMCAQNQFDGASSKPRTNGIPIITQITSSSSDDSYTIVDRHFSYEYDHLAIIARDFYGRIE